MCILLYVKLIWCSGIPQIYGQLEEGALGYVNSAIYETYLVQWYSIDLWSIGGGGPWYMCILLYVKLIWCSVIPYIMVNWRGTLVYVHSAICETYVVQWYSIDLWSIGVGGPWYVCILL